VVGYTKKRCSTGRKKQIDISNQNLKVVEAAFQQAEWIVAQARAGYFPTATIGASAQRSRGGGTAGGGTIPVGVAGPAAGPLTSSAPRPLRAGPRNIRQSRLVASAALIQALGGGREVAQLPSRERIEEKAPLYFCPLPPSIEEVRGNEAESEFALPLHCSAGAKTFLRCRAVGSHLLEGRILRH
jgi:hypothetical protein